MNITNYKSNLTPERDAGHGSGKSKFGILLSNKQREKAGYDFRKDASRGMSEHPCHVLNTMPYLPASTAF